MLRVLFCVAVALAAAEGFVLKAKLPPYIQRCSKSDLKLNECFVKSGNIAIPQLVKGDARYNIPSMIPLKLKEVVLRNDHQLKFILRNVRVFGLNKAQLKGVNLDFEQANFAQNLTIPRLNFLGDYELYGTILNEFVQGKGLANITIVNGAYTTKMKFKTEENRAVPYGSYTFYKPQIVVFNLDNLYDGNEFRASYFEQCRASDPQLAQCIIKSANKVIPRLAKGDVHYNFPNMFPLKLKELVIRNDHELRFILRNVEVRGLENTRMTDVIVSFEDLIYRQNLTIPRLNIIGNYEMSGRIVNQYVNGVGKANITIVNGQCTIGFSYTLDSELYATIISHYGSYRPQRVIYHFSNLLSGNDFLGYQTNVYLNNNWQEVSSSFRPAAEQIMINFVASIYQNVGNVVPFNEAFP